MIPALHAYFPFAKNTVLFFRIREVFPLYQPARIFIAHAGEYGGKSFFYFEDNFNWLHEWQEDKLPEFQWPDHKSKIAVLPGIFFIDEQGLKFSRCERHNLLPATELRHAKENLDSAELIIPSGFSAGTVCRNNDVSFEVVSIENLRLAETEYENCLKFRVIWKTAGEERSVEQYYAPNVGPVLLQMPSGIRYELIGKWDAVQGERAWQILPPEEAKEKLAAVIEEEKAVGETVFKKYEAENKSLPSPKHPRGNPWLWLLPRLIAFAALAPIAIAFHILRIPFRLVRKLRMGYMRRRHYRVNEDDEVGVPLFREAEENQTKLEKRAKEQLLEARQKFIESSAALQQDPSDLISRAKHASYLFFWKKASREAKVYKRILAEYDLMLQQVKPGEKISGDEKTTYGVLCRNLSIAFAGLYLVNLSRKFREFARKEGAITEKELRKGYYEAAFGFLISWLLVLPVNSLHKDVLNTWPR